MFACCRCNATFYGETCNYFKVWVGEHSGISPLTKKQCKSKNPTVIKDHMLIRNQQVSFDNFKVFVPTNSGFWLKIKESHLIFCDQLILTKNQASLSLYLISYINILQYYDYLVSSFMHCYLFFVVFSNKIYAPVSFKLLLTICW